MRGLDISAYQGEIPQAWFHARKAEGIGLCIVQLYGGGAPGGLGPNPYAQLQLSRARATGMQLAGYVIPSWAFSPGLDNAGEFLEELRFCALDVEDEKPVTREQVDGVRLRGVVPVVYTSASQWRAVMGDTLTFSDVPLWDARYLYSNPPPYGERLWPAWSEAVAYGGWPARVAWQWQGDITVDGVRCDLNLVSDGWLRNPTPNYVRNLSAAGTPGRQDWDLGLMGLQLPVESSRITQSFGIRSVTGILHRGVDFGVAYVPVKPMTAGVVRSAGDAGTYGTAIEVDHGGGFTSLYAHLSELKVGVGEAVGADTVMAISGNTGLSTAPHIHIEGRLSGTVFDWLVYVGGNELAILSDESQRVYERIRPNLQVFAEAGRLGGFTAEEDSPAQDDPESMGMRRLGRLAYWMQRPLSEVPEELRPFIRILSQPVP